MSALSAAQRRFALWALFATLLVGAGGYVFHQWFSARWQVAFAPTRGLCLPWRAMLADNALDAPIARGDLVWFHVDMEALKRAVSITLPFKEEHRFVKIVAGLPGDAVEIGERGVFVNGRYWGELDLLHKIKREARAFYRTEVVPPGHYFVLGSAPNSFDSRYWGPVPQERVIGRAEALI